MLWIMSHLPCLVLVLVCVMGLQAAETYNVFLVAGQSNAEGLNFGSKDFNTGGLGPQELVANPEDASVLLATGDIFKAKAELRALAAWYGNYGPEIGLGRGLVAQGIKQVVIIKLAKGGTSITQWGKGSTNDVTWSNLRADLYENLVERTRIASDELKARGTGGNSVVIRGFFWMQGEADAWHNGAVPYAGKLHQLISDLRADLAVPDLSFVIGRTAITQPAKDDGLELIRAAQLGVAAGTAGGAALGHGAWVDIDEITTAAKGATVDGIALPNGGLIDAQHLTPQGYEVFGRRWAKAWAGLAGAAR